MDKTGERVASLYGQARNHWLAGRHDETIRDCEAALRLMPDFIDALYLCAIAKKALNDFQSALIDFNAVLGKDPTYQEAYYARATVFYSFGEWANAVPDFT